MPIPVLPFPPWRIVARLGALAVAALTSSIVSASEPAETADVSSPPWVLAETFWFFHRGTDLAESQRRKITGISRYVAEHPGASVGILPPAGELDADRSAAMVDDTRVRVIREALREADILAVDLDTESLGFRFPALNRQILVFVRAAVAPGSNGG